MRPAAFPPGIQGSYPHEAEPLTAGDLRRSFSRLYDAVPGQARTKRLGREGFLVLLLVIAVWAAASAPQSLDALLDL